MPAKCSDIFRLIEEMAPLNLAESWDNSGLQVGDPRVEVEKVLLTLDVDIRVAREAKTRGCRLIVSHHPLLFKPAGSIRFDRPAGELIAYLVKNDLQVYAAHTNLDNAAGGVSKALAEELGLKKQAVLNQSGRERLLKLAVFVPLEHCEAVRNAMSEAGAGWNGNYSHCTFLTRGTGTFKPLQGTNPYIGKTGVVEHVDEIKIETVVPASRLEPVLQAMLEAHPYEEVAYDLYGLVNSGPAYGAGRLGELEETVSFLQFAEKVKSVLGLTALRLGGSFDSPVRKVAVCGGSGADFWQDALAAGADTFVTGDLKYHTAQDMLAAGLKFIDPGHFGTEAVVLPVLQRFLVSRCREKNMDVEIVLAQTNTDPFAYL